MINNNIEINEIISTLEALPSVSFINISNVDNKKIQTLIEILKFRVNKEVSEFVCYRSAYDNDKLIFEICPACNAVLERTYQAYCASCGQKLKWINHKDMTQRI